MTLNQLLKHYERERRPRPQTMRHRRSVLMTFSNDTGISDTDDVTHDALVRWRENVLDRATPVTWNNYLKCMRCLWHFGLEAGLFKHQPFEGITRVRVHQSLPKTVEEQAISEVIEYLFDEEEPMPPGWFWVLVIKTLYYTGMRRNQLVGVRWEHISTDFRTCVLSAEHSKNWSEYKITLDSRLSNDLAALRGLTSDVLGRAPLPSEQVFNVTLFSNRYCGNELSLGQVSGFFGRLSVATGVRVTAHMLRHTMATKLMQETGQISVISELLGHHDPRSTLRYLHPDLDQQRNAIGKLPAL